MKRNARGAYGCIVRSISDQLLRRQNFPKDLAKADAKAVTLTPTCNRELVTVLQPFAFLPVGQFQRIRAAPSEFKHAPARFLGLAADRSAREQIARLKVAAANGMVGELLRNAPIKILEICPSNRVRRFQLSRLQFRFELNIEGKIIFRAKIR